MSLWTNHKNGLCNAASCYYCKDAGDVVTRGRSWDGKCHGCELRIHQEMVAQIGPYWICDACIEKHFPNEQYSVNQAADILEKIRGFS